MTNIFKIDDIALRHVHPDDYDALFALNAIWDIVKNTGSWSYPPDPDQVLNRCTPIDATDGIRGVITHQGRVIGQAGLAGDMIYYALHPEFWGQGIITRVARALVEYAFCNTSLDVITSGVYSDNPASLRVMEKLGFREIDPNTWYSRARQGTVQCRNFALTRMDWALRNPPILHTDRLVLTPLTFDHLTQFAEILGHPDVAPMMMPATVPWPIDDAADILSRSIYLGRLGFRMAILAGERMVGTCGIGPSGSVMFAIHPDAWGQGFATEAMQSFISHIFARYTVDQITADHFTDNPASGAVLQKLGFHQTGFGTGTSAARLEPAPVLEYAQRNPNVRITS